MSFVKKINYNKYLILSAMMLMMFSLSIFGLEKGENGVYLIETKEDLIEFGKIVNGTHRKINQDREANAMLVNDIDLENQDWEPIGFEDNEYQGSFDGNSHVIENIKSKEKKYMGLFGIIGREGEVENLKLDEVKFLEISNCFAGGIAGRNSGKIKGCEVEKLEVEKVSESGYLGGIAGLNRLGDRKDIIEDCKVKYLKINGEVNVNVDKDVAVVGGIVGADEGEIKGCEVEKLEVEKVSRSGYVGGIAGVNKGHIESCKVEYLKINGEVNGDIVVDGEVTKGLAVVGGIVGNDARKIKGCEVGKLEVEKVSKSGYVGGIAGWYKPHDSIKMIEECEVEKVEVEKEEVEVESTSLGTERKGGFVGKIAGWIEW